MRIKLLGVIDEDPFDPITWSGSSKFFFDSLYANNTLYKAISATPPKSKQLAYKLLSFQTDLEKWKFKYHLNTSYFKQMTHAALKTIETFDTDAYNAILQVGAWYDFTHSNKLVASYHDGNLARRLESPYGYPNISQNHINKALNYERKLYSRIDYIFPMSQWLADSFCNDFSVDENKVFPVGAGINLPRIIPPSSSRQTTKKILFVGKDFRRKGGHILLEAFEVVKKHINNAELIIAGPELNDLPDGVRCEGFISKNSTDGINKLLTLYSEANVFALPTLYEPFGIAYAEAMAHKLPCIGTNNFAIPEIIDHGKTGFLIPPNDSQSLANSLITLLEDDNLCVQMGEQAFKKYYTNYRWEIVSKKITDILEKDV